MYYRDQDIKDLAQKYLRLNGKLEKLQTAFLLCALKNERAKEHATQGFGRRVKIMVRCIENVFRLIPPERSDLPTRDELSDATINIQSFVFNAFGAIDNLAWIWMHERGQMRRDGTPIPNGHVGIGPNNESVRATLSKEFQEYLTANCEEWFEHLSELRHALAHRIPLYIPPYVIQTKDEEAYKSLESKMNAAVKAGQFAEYDRLSVEQLALGKFRPWVQHSFQEGAKPIVFHAQMIADFLTVEEIAGKMLGELKSLRI